MTPAGRARGQRLVLAALSLGAAAVVLAALPFKAFDLDRFFVPKELALHVTATVVTLTLLARAPRLELTRVDTLLVGYLGLSAVSALVAPNGWLAARALAVSLSGAAVFWAARALARAGRARALLAALATAVVLTAVTSLLQAYGVESEYMSLNRAPGGTLGNRNFVAHLAAIGTPTLLLLALGARRRAGAMVGAAGVALTTAALILSRSRAAWLAMLGCAGIVAFAALAGWRVWRDARLGPRARLVVVGATVGALAALLLPNTLEWRSDSPYLDSMRGVINYREGSGRGRVIQYRNTLHMAAAHPLLGVGPGNWPVRYPRYASPGDPSLDRDDAMTANPWPSSDWAAVLSERGAPAFLLLLLTFAGLGVGALLAMTRARRAEQLMPPVALVATLTAMGVVGAFDALLLLPTPALLVWALLGALAPHARTRTTIALTPSRRRWGLAGVAVVGLLASLRSGTQAAAMAAYSDPGGRLAAMERAARLDPGSYRIHIRIAEAAARRGRCEGVREHARAAGALFPSAPEPRRLLARCEGRSKRGRAAR